MQTVKGRLLVKLENLTLGKTASGLVYKKDLSVQQRYGHIVSIHDEDKYKTDLRVGDRVLFLKNFTQVIPYRNTDTKMYIAYVLCSVIINGGVVAKVPEEYDVLDIMNYGDNK